LTFNGFTITDVSIVENLTENKQYYKGDSSTSNKNYSIQFLISSSLISKFKRDNPLIKKGAKYDIIIENLYVSSFSCVTVVAGAIKETGVSQRELFNRRLEKYCNDNRLYRAHFEALPYLVTRILALTSKNSEIKDDIISNLGLLDSSGVDVVNCKDSLEIANLIKSAQNRYDLVVLFRGGREDDAMMMFSQEPVLEALAESTIPTCAALGHDKDRPFVYNLVSFEYSTPNGFSEAISKHNWRTLSARVLVLEQIANSLKSIEFKSVKHIQNCATLTVSAFNTILTNSNTQLERNLERVASHIDLIESSIFMGIDFKCKEIESESELILANSFASVERSESTISHISSSLSLKKLSLIESSINNVENHSKALSASIMSFVDRVGLSILKSSDDSKVATIASIERQENSITSTVDHMIMSKINEIESHLRLAEGFTKRVEDMAHERSKHESEKTMLKRRLILVIVVFVLFVVAVIVFS
jgi:exonuclease VII large subunit